jgi:hypothetical protein
MARLLVKQEEMEKSERIKSGKDASTKQEFGRGQGQEKKKKKR